MIKIGTGVLTRDNSAGLHHAMIARLAQSIADVQAAGHQCLLVSSGAVGAGVVHFGLEQRPKDIALLQACAAAGQSTLMHLYESQFSLHDLKVAQLLLTHSDLENQERLGNVNNTLSTLLDYPQIIPIINQNDSVATFELNVGDNDELASRVAQLVNADTLLLLTAVPGLRGPDAKDEADIIPIVDDVKSVFAFALDETGALSVGGMGSKLRAVDSAVEAGIETVIASGFDPEQISELIDGKGIGTRFTAK